MYPGKQSTWDSGAWHPDTRASLAGAVAAALLVMAGFFALFSAAPILKLSHDTQSPIERLMLAEPVPPPPAPRLRVPSHTPPVTLPLLPSAWPPLLAPVTAPGGFTQQDYLDERARGNAAALRAKVMGSDLQRVLGKPTEKQALPDNQSFRSIDGQKIVRSGGGCAQIQTVQGSSSPTNRINLAEPTGCPGVPSEQEEMAKALQDWADKHRPPPPP